MPEVTASPGTLLDAVRRLDPGYPVLEGLTRGELTSRSQTVAEAVRAHDAVGEAVVLRMPNGPGWVVAFLGLLAGGGLPLPVAPDTPDAEVRRLLALAGGGRVLAHPGRPGEEIALTGPPGARVSGGPGVLLPTSGSTGSPKLVRRDEASWLSEARRYRDGVGVSEEDTLLLPVPLSHAYALGWLCGGLLSGAALRPVPPTALGQTARELAEGATVIALVPTTARLLATRQRLRARRAHPGSPAAPRLRVAMVGAGPVDASLDALFTEAYGIGVARNYGSTELGAVLSGPAGLPPLCVGAPLPGVEHRLVDPVTRRPRSQGPGVLQIRTDAVPDWHDTGDLAVPEAGSLRILGREGTAVRRGGRWVAPLEIEAVLRAHEAVREVRVSGRPRGHEGEDGIEAEVVVAPGGPDEGELRAHAARHLAPYKVPDTIVLRSALPRTASGKTAAATRYRLTPRAIEATRAYKSAELLFALHELGALTALAEGTASAPLSTELGCDPQALEILLDTAASLGLLSTAPGHEGVGRAHLAELDAFIRLEERLSRDLVTREALAAVARSGQARRPFERRPRDADHAELVSVYQGAMCGPSALARTALGLRLLRPRPGARLVEVTAGPGRYLDRLLAKDPTAGGHLWQTGRLSGRAAGRVDEAVTAGRVSTGPALPVGRADVCVISNAVHDPASGALLSTVLAALRPGGLLLVDDVFLPSGKPGGGDTGPAAGAELALDWLTHGGTAWTTVEALTTGLAEAGADVVRHLPFDPSPCHLVIAKEAD